MKKIILSILTIGTLAITSCTSDPCKDLTATTKCNGKGVLVANGSSCDCQCDAGYSGADCNTLVITSAIGTYAQVSTALVGSTPNARTGSTVIVADVPAVSRVKITNLNQYFGCVNGGATSDVICYANIVNGELILEETAQCGVVFKGKGVKLTAGNGWKFNYTATNSTATHTCETTITK